MYNACVYYDHCVALIFKFVIYYIYFVYRFFRCKFVRIFGNSAIEFNGQSTGELLTKLPQLLKFFPNFLIRLQRRATRENNGVKNSFVKKMVRKSQQFSFLMRKFFIKQLTNQSVSVFCCSIFPLLYFAGYISR